MSQLSNRQIGILLSLSIISLKLFILPSEISRYAGNNAYISLIISLMVEFLFIILILFVMKRNPEKSFFEILELKLGKMFTKIISVILFIYFLGKSFIAIKELQNFLVQLLFEHISWWKFVVPLVALILYILNKSLRTFARSVQFFFYFVVVGAGITLILPIQQLELVNLLPIFSNGIMPVLQGSFYTSFHFIDFLVLFIFMGRIKYSKKTANSVIKYSLFTYLFILLFYVFYIGLFGNILVNEGLLVSDIPLYSNYPSTNGRLEWLSMIVWTIVLIYQASLMLICARESLSNFTTIKNNSILSIILLIIISIMLYIAYLDYAGVIKIITTKVFNIILLAFMLVLAMILFWCCRGGLNEAKNTKNGK